MKVLKVIVDEVPKSCQPCEFSVDVLNMCSLMTRELEEWGFYKERPDWCPLEVGIPFVFPPTKEEFGDFLKRLKDNGLAIEFTFNVVEREE